MDIDEETYIGDGVYASFDGYQVWLRADENRIALEPAVMQGLQKYVEALAKRLQPEAH